MTHKKHPSLEDASALEESTQPQEEPTSMFQQAIEAYKRAHAPHTLSFPKPLSDALGREGFPPEDIDAISNEDSNPLEDIDAISNEDSNPLEDIDAISNEDSDEALPPNLIRFLRHLSTLSAGATREQAYEPFPEQKKRIDDLIDVSEEYEAILRNLEETEPLLGEPLFGEAEDSGTAQRETQGNKTVGQSAEQSIAVGGTPNNSTFGQNRRERIAEGGTQAGNPAVGVPRWTRLTTLFFCTSLVLLGVLIVSIRHLRQVSTVAHEALVRVDRPNPPISPIHPTPSPDVIEKGAKRSVQMLYVREPLTLIGQYATSRTTLREGDIVSFQFSFKQPAFVMIASLDDNGVVSFYHPHLASDDAISPRLEGQGTIPENKSPQRSITLDASKGRESIFVIGSARPFTAKEIRAEFSSRYPRGSDLFQFIPFTSSPHFWMIRRFDIFKK